MNINKCAPFQVNSYTEVGVELYWSMKGLLSKFNGSIDILGSVIEDFQIESYSSLKGILNNLNETSDASGSAIYNF